MSSPIKAELTGSFPIPRRGRPLPVTRSGQDWLLAGFLVMSASLHVVFVLVEDFSVFGEPTPLIEEWAMDAEIVTDIDFGAPPESALPDAQKAPEAKAPEDMLPQLPKKFAINEALPEEEVTPDEMVEPTKELEKVEKKIEEKKVEPKKIEEVKAKPDDDEQNRLKKSEALERLMKEKLRQDKKIAKNTQAPLDDPIARLSNEVLKRKTLNSGAYSGRASAQAQKYGGRLNLAITRNYTLPSVYNYKDRKLAVQVDVVVAENGDLRSLKVTQASGEAAFDDFVVEAVKASAPLPPPPKELLGKQITLSFTPGSF